MSTTASGWYPDPDNPAMLRYWDGSAWTEQRSAPSGPSPAITFAPTSGYDLSDPAALAVYNLGSLDQLSREQRERFMAHRLTTYPIWLLIILHFLTLGLFTFIYQGLHFSKLPHAREDDFDSGKAIGFMFIPIYSLYWTFRFVHSLIDRVNFQLRLRGRQPRISRGLGTTSAIFSVIPYFGPLVTYVILMPIVAGQVQSAVNELARERKRQLFEGPRPELPLVPPET
jgi:hypothetical protein